MDKGGDICLRIGVKEDDLVVLLLNAAITLINTYDIDQLENMPRKLSEAFSVYLKELWVKDGESFRQLQIGRAHV